MANFLLTDLRTMVRERADMPVAGFVADSSTSLDKWINDAVMKLHRRLVDALGEDYQSTEVALTANGTTSLSIGLPVLKLYGVDVVIGGQRRTLKPFSRNERNAYRNSSIWFGTDSIPRYRLKGNGIVSNTASPATEAASLELLPAPPSGTQIYVQYAPPFTPMDGSVITGVQIPNGWEKYVILDAAIQCLMKEESDTRELRQELAVLESEIDRMKEERDASMPRQTVDVDNVDIFTLF